MRCCIRQMGTADDSIRRDLGLYGLYRFALLLSVQDRQHIESRIYRTLTDRRNTNHEKETQKKTYNILYANPPWRYECKRTGAAEHHYPTMSIDDLCALPVETLAGKDCLLFFRRLSHSSRRRCV